MNYNLRKYKAMLRNGFAILPNIKPKQSPIPRTAVITVLCLPANQCSLTSVGIQVMKGVAIPNGGKKL